MSAVPAYRVPMLRLAVIDGVGTGTGEYNYSGVNPQSNADGSLTYFEQ